MVSETTAFGGSFGGLLLAAILIVAGVFMGGLTPVTYAGMVVGLLAIAGLTVAVVTA